MTPTPQQFASALCITAAIGGGLGAAPAPTQQVQSPAPGAADWSRAGGALFPGLHAAELDGPDRAWNDIGKEADPESATDGATRIGSGVAPAPLRLPPSAQPFDQFVEEAANRHGLDPKLLHALVAVESAYRPLAVSPAGAGGLAQLMPGTASELGVRDRFDPADNLNGAAAYLAEQLLRFGDVRLALAAYNSGPQRVARLGRVPDIAETRAYVIAVTECYLVLAAGRPIRSRADCGP